jgi:hypothetical protein
MNKDFINNYGYTIIEKSEKGKTFLYNMLSKLYPEYNWLKWK